MTNPSSPGGQFPNYPQGMNSGLLPPPPPGYPAPARGTNVMAIMALVFAFRVQKLLGHASVSTTQIYAAVPADARCRAVLGAVAE